MPHIVRVCEAEVVEEFKMYGQPDLALTLKFKEVLTQRYVFKNV